MTRITSRTTRTTALAAATPASGPRPTAPTTHRTSARPAPGAPSTHRAAPRHPLAALALAAAATVLAAGVTAVAAPLGASPAQAMGLPRMVPDRLTVSYDDGAGHNRTYTLTCTRFSGGPACEQLERIGGPVPAVPGGQACPMIYGGPERADVAGTWDGRPVKESYRRTNGCEVSRWSRMVPALPAPGPAARPGPLLG